MTPCNGFAGPEPNDFWQQVDAFVQPFERAWEQGARPAIDDFLPKDEPLRQAVLKALIHVDQERRQRAGEQAPIEEYLKRYPHLATAFSADTTKHLPPPQATPDHTVSTALPQQIGRYRVERVLGHGSFGMVYLAHDDQLSRPVAIKVPHPRLVLDRESIEAYRTEAQAVANLDHPHIVPIFDVGSTKVFPFFCVSRFIDGTTLALRLRADRPTFAQTRDIVAAVADALHYAHGKGLFHRDIKPGNIMLDASGKPFVVDFGLALKEENVGQGSRYCGTPPYMSPEQARGEGHRVDGRSDVFSLGVVLYELLMGKRPFQAKSRNKLVEQITLVEPRPPRQINDRIPKELERICLKALAKRATERYTTAKDMADDLRQCVDVATREDPRSPAPRPPQPSPWPITTPAPGPTAPISSVRQVLKILPKGLRSFDEDDADFFLELLPGPRDRNRLPDSIHFWKTKIEELDPDKTFPVGLLYGPSGCGKSSLVKAGLLPRLSKDVVAVYLEATSADTEARLHSRLRRRCPGIPVTLGVKESLAALRQGLGLAVGTKVVIVLDQFEQWLHAHRQEHNNELVEGLRQCDGAHVQCIVMVRDDFWMAATRFMRQLEIPLREGLNSAPVDLFDVDHANKVLAAFGRAFGKLPENSVQMTREQRQFLLRAIAGSRTMPGLAQEDKVICVRLAVFAEMMKGKPWSIASLRAVGGITGLGVSFLEETFSSPSAPPEHRYHQKAARAVLKTLLPEPGTDIKAHMKSYQELLEASGYTRHVKNATTTDFDDLLRMLDKELRLITPTDPEGRDEEGGTKDDIDQAPNVSSAFYQLTHDYLVHSLRDWLTRKEGETASGRARVLLADRAVAWNARPENRQLPSLLQWARIGLLTRQKDWTSPQCKMMARAGRYHGLRLAVLAAIVALVAWVGHEAYGTFKAHSLRDQLLHADTKNVLGIISEMAPYRRWIDPLLRETRASKGFDTRKQLHVSLALLPVDSSQTEYLYARLLDAAAPDVAVLCEALAPHQSELCPKLWTVVEQPVKGQDQRRLRAACALARYDPGSEGWTAVAGPVVDDLVSVSPAYLERWMDCLKPVRDQLQASLEAVFRNPERAEVERNLATSILADYVADRPQQLVDLLLDADAKQLPPLYERMQEYGESAIKLMRDEIVRPLAQLPQEPAREKLAKRKATAAVVLLRMGHASDVWPLLQHSTDPRVRSYLVHRLGPMGADSTTLVKRLEQEPDLTIRRALVLSLGSVPKERWLPGEREALLDKLRILYQKAKDPGLRASAEWLLRQWQQDPWLTQADAQWTVDQGRKHLDEIRSAFAKEKDQSKPQWYVNGQGQTMVALPCPMEFVMGSPASEADRQEREPQHRRRILHSFALSAKHVTVAQYRAKVPNHRLTENMDPRLHYPAFHVTWTEAAAYCNWLSEKEGLNPSEWCFERDCSRLKPGYLGRTGYRLPTEAEMEYANRAGAVTSRYYGQSPELLPEYAWYVPNAGGRCHATGWLKPNDFGLFDMHGNLWCWCIEEYQPYPAMMGGTAVEDKEGALDINPRAERPLRGNCYTDHASFIRSASRWSGTPGYQSNLVGFRVARTIRTD
jgi:serine/threonine protein kinase/formylglycine-generating enzyme required for sulfatase activity